MILVSLATDSTGAVYATPVSAIWREAFASHMRQHTGHASACAYFQVGTDELAGCIPDRKLRELSEGYAVTCRVDPWEFGHWLGYDAHTVAEIGPRASLRHDKQNNPER
jgi:hypothetical protein